MMEAQISISRRSLLQEQATDDSGAALTALFVRAEYMPLDGFVNYEIRADPGGEPQYLVPILDKHMGEFFANEPVLFGLLFGHRTVLAARPMRAALRFSCAMQPSTIRI